MIEEKDLEILKDLSVHGGEREVLQVIAQLLFDIHEFLVSKKK